MKKLHFVTGDKGGVGKSWLSTLLATYLHANGRNTYVIDTDNGNPDVLAPFLNSPVEGINGELIQLDDADGWLALGDVLENTDAEDIIVNHGARGNQGAAEHGAAILQNLSEFDAELHIYWLLNNELDGLKSLTAFYGVLDGKFNKFNMIPNEFFGKDFSVYVKSNIRKKILENNGDEFYLPVLPTRIAAQIRVDELHLCDLTKFSIVNRITARNFLENVSESLEKIGA